MHQSCRAAVLTFALFALHSAFGPSEVAWTQDASPSRATTTARPTDVTEPLGYTIGMGDVLRVLFWGDDEMTGDVVVRPDGMITLPLIGDLQALGLTPEGLGDTIQQAAGRYFEDVDVTLIVREINSRHAFITGMVAAPGAYPLAGPRTVLQLIALAGGLLEYADEKKVRIIRLEQGATRTFEFNYKDVAQGKNLEQNIRLNPGDTVVVP